MKNIFKKTVKGVAPQDIKKKYNKTFLITLILAILLALCLYSKIIPVRFCVLLWGLITGGWVFYGGYLGVRYKMIGGFGSFPNISGKAAIVFGWIYCILALLIVGVSYIMFLKLAHHVI